MAGRHRAGKGRRTVPRLQSVAVIGAGAVGSFYGSLLQRSGCRVEFLTRSGAAPLARRKLMVKSVWGDFSLRVRALAAPQQLQPADLVFVALKVLPSIPLRRLIAPALHPESVIILVQNGINHDQQVARMFPGHTVLGGLAFTCINRISPRRIVHAAYGQIQVGYGDARDQAVAEAVVELFQRAGIQCSLGGALRPLRWKKLLWNVPFNCLSVVCGGVTTDQLVASPHSLSLARTLMQEVRSLARAEGHRLPLKDIEQMIENTRKMVPYKTSMLIDYERGQPMEVDAILGQPCKVAKHLGVAVPALESLRALLSFYDERNNQTSG